MSLLVGFERIFAFSIVLVGFWAMQPSSSVAQAEFPRLYTERSEPLSIFISNPPEGFVLDLNTLNEEVERVFKPQETGSEPSEADIWVFFLASESDVADMHHLPRQAYELRHPTEEKPQSRYIEFTSEDGRKKGISYQFFENYDLGGGTEREFACRAAIDVFDAVSGVLSHEDLKRFEARCLLVS